MSSELERFERALRVFWSWRDDRPQDSDTADLLDAHQDLRDYLEPLLNPEAVSVHPSSADADATTPPTLTLDDFEIVREIGRGGMGVVYEAIQHSLGRRVALKVLPIGPWTTAERRARFEREARLAARIRHPGIARILAVGSTEDRQYYAMDLVEGSTLSAAIRRVGLADSHRVASKLTAADLHAALGSETSFVRAAVDIVRQVARALDNAHGHGVLHRDVKPSNIMLDAAGLPVLVDFGLAQDAEGDSASRTGSYVGTPLYMAPEQARGAGDAIDARTDVHALGATLFELLTGHPPFAPRGSSTGPAAALAAILTAPAPDPRRHDRGLPRDLSSVCLRALEKDPARRYPSADAFADDLDNVLGDRPVLARRPSALRHLNAWRRRHPMGAASLVAGLAVLGIGLAVFALVTVDLVSREALARDARERGDYRTSIRAASEALAAGTPPAAATHLESTPPAQRGWEWHHLRSRLTEWTVQLHSTQPLRGALCVTPDARWLLAAREDGRVGVWDLTTGALERVHDLGLDVTCVAPRLADATTRPPRLAVGTAAGTVHLVEFASGPGCAEAVTVRSAQVHARPVTQLSITGTGSVYSSDGHAVTRLAPDGSITTVTAGDPDVDDHLDRVFAVTPIVDDSIVVLGTTDHRVRTTNAVTVLRGTASSTTRPHASATAIALDATRRRALIATQLGSILVRPLAGTQSIDHAPATEWSVHRQAVVALAVPDDGRYIASLGRDGTVRLLDPETGATRRTIAHLQPGRSLAVSADGEVLAATHQGARTVSVWRMSKPTNQVLREFSSQVHHVCWSPDSRFLATATVYGKPSRAYVHAAASGAKIAELFGAKPQVFDRDSRRVYFDPGYLYDIGADTMTAIPVATEPAPTRRWRALETFLPSAPAGTLQLDHYTALHPDHQTALVVPWYSGPEIRAVRLADNATLRHIGAGERRFWCVLWNREATQFVSGERSGDVVFWDAETWEPIGAPIPHPDTVYDVDFTPDEARLATACGDGCVRIFATDTRELLVELRGHEAYVRALAFSPDGTRLATASADRTVRIWDTRPVHARAGK